MDDEAVPEEGLANTDSQDAFDALDSAVDDLDPADLPEGDTWSQWSNLWQMPAIILGLALIAVGAWVAINRAPENDFDGALDQIAEMIDGGHLEEASHQLSDVLPPRITEADNLQQARFHALVADWLAAWQQAQRVSDASQNERIDSEYAAAVEGGLVLSPIRIEQWANALIDLGRLEEARTRLEELDAIDFHSESGDQVRDRRNRVLRRLVEQALRQEDLPFDTMMALLAEYREDPRISAADDAWATARQAELRLETGKPREAIDHMLVDMRRIENRGSVSFGELYALLGRAYYDLGRDKDAEFQLERAIGALAGTDPVRGDVLVLLGQIDISRDALEEAFGRFDLVVREFPSTRSFLPGLLGRAEIRSVLGDHSGSLADYERITSLIGARHTRRDVTPQRIARSLCDRHDATLATGQLTLALDYVRLTEQFFERTDVPLDVLMRIASTSRQHAENLMASASLQGHSPNVSPTDVEPAVRHEANQYFVAAAEAFLRHARAAAALDQSDDDWADSMWRAGDCYDTGGRPDKAIPILTEYLSGRPISDPRRSEVAFRLAQAHQAEQKFDLAVERYEEVILDHARSPYASQCHVPLAQSLISLDRIADAERVLSQVVSGNRILAPESVDFRNALVALGDLHYEAQQYARAIERLNEATERYPDHSRITEIRFRLADSYRRSALQATDRLAEVPAPPPEERRRLQTMRVDHLRRAAEEFEKVATTYRAMDVTRLDGVQRQFRRLTHLYRGDCAFALGQYEKAIQHYDHAARVHNSHYASLSALIQIVNCYSEMQDWERAAAAHRRAQDRLRQLPADAFNDPSAVMDRAAWEQWLANSPPGLASAGASGAASSPNNIN